MRYIKPPDFKSVKDLEGYYKQVETEITELLTNDASARTANELNNKLAKALNAAVSYLTVKNKQFTTKELPTAFVEGVASVHKRKEKTKEEASAILEKQGFKYAKNGFSNNTYIELHYALLNSTNALKKRVNDTIEQLRKEGKDSVYNVQQSIIREYETHSIFEVEYSNGAKQPLHAYAAMAARSARIESTNIGAIGSALQTGTDLVKMTTMPQCCKVCGAYQGKVYSISGKDKRFPALFKTVLKNGYALPHPNCRHEFIPFYEEMETPEDIEKAIQKSKIKYDKQGQLIDVRYQKDIKAYQAWQAGNRQLNAEYLEFERMRKHYAGREDEMPYKTLAGFRRARRADDLSPAFKAWRYRERDRQQYERWKGIIGAENMPEDVDKFQDIRYNNLNKYTALKIAISDAEIREKIGGYKYPLTVQQDKQGKHIKGHRNYIEGKSYLAVASVENGQLFADYLIQKYSKTGRLVRDKNNKWVHKEIVETEEVVGFIKGKDGNFFAVKRATIHYAKDGTHIVPA